MTQDIWKLKFRRGLGDAVNLSITTVEAAKVIYHKTCQHLDR